MRNQNLGVGDKDWILRWGIVVGDLDRKLRLGINNGLGIWVYYLGFVICIEMIGD